MRLTLKVLSIAAHLVSEASGEAEVYQVKWMWGDADFMGAGHAMARKNPVRWSHLMSPQDTIAQLQTEKTVAPMSNGDREVDVMIVDSPWRHDRDGKETSPLLKIWVDKKMPSIDAAIAKIEKWTTEESARAEEERIEREARLTRYAVQWMWRGAGWIPGLAKMDPLNVRWSKWKSVKDTIDDQEFDYPGERSVFILEGSRWNEEKKEYLEIQRSQFPGGMDEAITALNKRSEDSRFKWKYSSGREIMAKQGEAEERRIESFGTHVDDKPFIFWSESWQSREDIIADMQAQAQGERDRRNARAVQLRLKKVYGDQYYADSDPWEEPAAKTGTVPEAIKVLKAYKEEEDAQSAAHQKTEL